MPIKNAAERGTRSSMRDLGVAGAAGRRHRGGRTPGVIEDTDRRSCCCCPRPRGLCRWSKSRLTPGRSRRRATAVQARACSRPSAYATRGDASVSGGARLALAQDDSRASRPALARLLLRHGEASVWRVGAGRVLVVRSERVRIDHRDARIRGRAALRRRLSRRPRSGLSRSRGPRSPSTKGLAMPRHKCPP